MGSPILFLQWLPPKEEREIYNALREHGGEINISHADVSCKQEALSAMKEWFKGNENTQYLYIGAHGIKNNGVTIGIGATGSDFLPWKELWEFLLAQKTEVVVWFGACSSSSAAQAWSPIPPTIVLPASRIYGFSKDVGVSEIAKVLHCLMGMTGLDPLVFVEEELDRLRASVPETSLELHYPAYTLKRVNAYVNTDNFIEDVGISFKEFKKK